MGTPPTRPRSVPASPYPQQDVQVLGNRIRFVDIGPTTPRPGGEAGDPLLVVPGHTARIEGFDTFLADLIPSHRVLVLDLPGSGYSDRPDRMYTLDFYEETILSFLDALDVSTATPVGGSLGGNLVLRLGHRARERFPRLVVWAPGSAWRARPWLGRLTRTLGGRLTFWPSVLVQSRFWYSPDYPGRRAALDETFAYYREVMCPGFVRMYWGIAADQVATSLFDIAPAITQPVLLMWGDLDNGAGMREGVAHLRDLLPDCEFHVFEGARHSLETEIPTDLARVIEDFL
ncbi:MAG: alpha/beta hydrolase [Acidimicrobiia bacterium]|nr:alpha/beta hydrolase [Acidimicrobiia bacterium]